MWLRGNAGVIQPGIDLNNKRVRPTDLRDIQCVVAMTRQAAVSALWQRVFWYMPTKFSEKPYAFILSI